jgi:hypothetical protein
MILRSAAFDPILDALQPELAAGGFELVEARGHPEAFGSRYATFGDGARLVRLVWDGKERWFVLEGDDASHYRLSSGGPVWVDLTLQRFEPREADARRSRRWWRTSPRRSGGSRSEWEARAVP